MLTHRFPVSLLAALLFVACGGVDGDDAGWQGSVRDSASVTLVDNAETTSIARRFAAEPALVVGGEGAAPEAEFFQVVGTVLLDDGRVVVADGSSGELRYFAPDGGFLRAVGGTGEGPGEFAQLSQMTRHRDDTIAAYDRRQRTVSLFADEGDLARSISLRDFTGVTTTFVGVLDDGSVALVDEGASLEVADASVGAAAILRDTITVLRVAPGGEQIDTIARRECGFVSVQRVSLPGRGTQPFPFPMLFSPTPLVSVAGQETIVGDCEAYALYHYSGTDVSLDRIVRLQRAAVPVSQDDVSVLTQLYGDFLGEEPNPFFALTIETAIGAPAVEYMPQYAGLPARPVSEEDGHIWVPRYSPAMSASVIGEDPPFVDSGWDVFDARGRFVGVVEAPPRFRLTDLRQGRAIGIQRSADDVEQVVVYEVARVNNTTM